MTEVHIGGMYTGDKNKRKGDDMTGGIINRGHDNVGVVNVS